MCARSLWVAATVARYCGLLMMAWMDAHGEINQVQNFLMRWPFFFCPSGIVWLVRCLSLSSQLFLLCTCRLFLQRAQQICYHLYMLISAPEFGRLISYYRWVFLLIQVSSTSYRSEGHPKGLIIDQPLVSDLGIICIVLGHFELGFLFFSD